MPGLVGLSEDQQKRVKRQVEFYFSDSNIPRDEFLLEQVSKHPDGYVDLSLICAFSRMREILKLGEVSPDDVSDDVVKAVADTLRGSEVVAVSDSGFQVKRLHPIPSLKESQKIVDERSLYVRPFSMFATLDTIVDFFRDADVSFNAVRLRRHPTSKSFKGSLFIELTTKEEADRVLGLALEYQGAPLRCEPKKKYLGRKMAERKRKKETGELPPDAVTTLEILEGMDSEGELAAFESINKRAREAGAAEFAEAPTFQQQHRQDQFRQDQQRQFEHRQQSQQQQQQQQEAPAAAAAAAGGSNGAAAAAADGGDVAMQEAADAAPEFIPGLIVELVLRRVVAPDSRPPSSLIGLIKESLGGGVRYVEFMRPDEQEAQQQQQNRRQQQQQQQQQRVRVGGEQQQEGEGEQQQQEEGGQAEDAAAQEQQEQGEGKGAQDGSDAAATAAAAAPAAAEGEQQQQQQQQEGGEEELRYMLRFVDAEAAAASLAAFNSEAPAAAAGEGEAAAASGGGSSSKQVAGLPASLRGVVGEEEIAYHKRAAAKFNAAARQRGAGGRGGRGGFRGGGGGRGGRGGFRGGRGGRGGFRGGRGGFRGGRGGRGRF